MTEVRISPRAYSKILLHAAKYPHASVNGLLIAEQTNSKKSPAQSTTIVDVIPLFHLCLHVTPMVEIALTQVDLTAAKKGLTIVGMYTINEFVDDVSIEKPATRIADKIAETTSSAFLIMVDNRKLSLSLEDPALVVMTWDEGKWSRMDQDSYFVEPGCTESASCLIQNRETVHSLQDFDNHLDDLNQDYWNARLNKQIESVVSEMT